MIIGASPAIMAYSRAATHRLCVTLGCEAIYFKVALAHVQEADAFSSSQRGF